MGYMDIEVLKNLIKSTKKGVYYRISYQYASKGLSAGAIKAGYALEKCKSITVRNCEYWNMKAVINAHESGEMGYRENTGFEWVDRENRLAKAVKSGKEYLVIGNLSPLTDNYSVSNIETTYILTKPNGMKVVCHHRKDLEGLTYVDAKGNEKPVFVGSFFKNVPVPPVQNIALDYITSYMGIE